MGPRGHELLREMERLGIILDATHLCDDSFRDALDHFRGPVWASHSNSRTLVAHNRQFSDDQIRELIARGAVIGAAFDAWMIVPGWVRGKSTPEISRRDARAASIDHIDHICQIAGNARHCMIGSDLDGAFGREQCPVGRRDDRRPREDSRRSWPRAATTTTMSPTSCTGTSCGSCARRGHRPS